MSKLFLYFTYKNLCGAAINLMAYSKVNQPTKTASATSKKYSSSERKIDKVKNQHSIECKTNNEYKLPENKPDVYLFIYHNFVILYYKKSELFRYE